MPDTMTINLIVAVVALLAFISGGIASYIERHKQTSEQKDNSPSDEKKTPEASIPHEEVLIVKTAEEKTAREISGT